MPVSIRLSKDIEERLNKLSKLTGRSKTYYIKESIEQHLDEIEDLYLAEQRLIDLRSGKSKTYTLKEVEKELGLEDWVWRVGKKRVRKIRKTDSKTYHIFFAGAFIRFREPKNYWQSAEGFKIGWFLEI